MYSGNGPSTTGLLRLSTWMATYLQRNLASAKRWRRNRDESTPTTSLICGSRKTRSKICIATSRWTWKQQEKLRMEVLGLAEAVEDDCIASLQGKQASNSLLRGCLHAWFNWWYPGWHLEKGAWHILIYGCNELAIWSIYEERKYITAKIESILLLIRQISLKCEEHCFSIVRHQLCDIKASRVFYSNWSFDIGCHSGSMQSSRVGCDMSRKSEVVVRLLQR